MDLSILLSRMSKGRDFNMARQFQCDFDGKQNCEAKQNTTVTRPLILDSLPLLNPFITHLPVDPSESR
jgi:hypothetical protein